MYIKKVKIKDIRSISNFEMEFESSAGWHVVIGDNGAGKSTLIRAIALALVGPEEALGLRIDWDEWLSHNKNSGLIRLDVEKQDCDKHTGRQAKLKNWLVANIIQLKRVEKIVELSYLKTPKADPFKCNWGRGHGWFSAAYGPYRRFAGGNQDWTKVFYSQPKLGSHLSAFGEDVALTETIEWLVKLNYKLLEKKESGVILNDLKSLINSQDFLPHNTKLFSVSSDGVIFEDGNGIKIQVNQLSDGFRSVLSMTFELIRQLIRVYDEDNVFENIRKGEMIINLPGVVLIDEIDAHLHPTWQTRIGQWFTKYFPKIQFIVSTHSPLVCRACENGSIWRLAAPGIDLSSGVVEGADRNSLINGDVLDAYGTAIFGKGITIAIEAVRKKERLVELSNKKRTVELSTVEEKELIHLQTIFPADDTINF